jgi:hypothetical protein
MRACIAMIFVLGCQSRSEEMIEGLEHFRDRMCECEDAGCRREARRAYQSWSREHRDALKPKHFTEAQGRYIDEVERQLRTCRTGPEDMM